MKNSLENNLSIYRWFVVTSSILPWLAVFYLFFIERVTAAEAISLGGIYYLAVVALEVPSGYFSDRMGRKPVLVLSSVFSCAACILYLLSTGFGVLVIAQCFLAASIAFKSGSDSSLLYDTLTELNREAEYGDIEARNSVIGLIVLAVSCVVGGLLGLLDLRLVYLMTLVASLAQLYVCLQFMEPPQTATNKADSFLRQLGHCAAYLKDGVLSWVLGIYVLGYALQHVPYEFFQAYVALLDDVLVIPGIVNDTSSVTSGVLIGVSMFGGALGAAISMSVYRRLGLVPTLLLGITVICIIIGGMALVLHPFLLVLIMCRNLPMSMVDPVIRAAIVPRIRSEHRATYLSLQSLLGRLLFAGMLFMLASIAGEVSELEWPVLSQILRISGYCGVAALVLLVLTAGIPKRELGKT